MDARTAPLLIRKAASLLKRSFPIAPFFNTYADMRIERMASMRCWEVELELVHNL
ncbi:MAG: hypothetical protein AAB090_02970 [Nitrospirota bacterium]